MLLEEIIKELGLEVRCAAHTLNKQVSGGYASDLLSDVMANAKKDNIWVTLQIHQNITPCKGSSTRLSQKQVSGEQRAQHKEQALFHPSNLVDKINQN